jgi:hypothetical protein
MYEDGTIASVGNKVSQHIQTSTGLLDLNGKNWFDFICPDEVEEVRKKYQELIDNRILGKEIVYDIQGTLSRVRVKWLSSYVNHEYNLIMSIGIPLVTEEEEDEYEKLRKYYTDMINRDRDIINTSKEDTKKYADRMESLKNEKIIQ